MTDSSANATDTTAATLKILCHYIDTLLPILNDNKTDSTSVSIDPIEISNTSNKQDKNASLLWVLQDQHSLTALESQLKISNEDNAMSTLHRLSMQPTPQRYQLVCFWLPTLSIELLGQYIPLLMRYRDLYAVHIIIALDDALDLRAYGFTPLSLVDNEILAQTTTELSSRVTLWQFNLYDYKQLPNWLNSDYWANPENWDKHRW